MKAWTLTVTVGIGMLYGCGGGGATGPSGTDTGSQPPVSATPTPTPTPVATPTPTPEPTPDPGPSTLRRARFRSANGYTTEGHAAIVLQGGSHQLWLEDDFRTSRSGALDVRLCRNDRCSGDFLDLGAIQAFSGMQSYGLSDDGGAYSHVVIWCRAVSLPFGTGELQ